MTAKLFWGNDADYSASAQVKKIGLQLTSPALPAAIVLVTTLDILRCPINAAASLFLRLSTSPRWYPYLQSIEQNPMLLHNQKIMHV